MFNKLPSISFSTKKERSEFDSILPLTNKSSIKSKSSVLEYIYETTSTIGSVLADSYQVKFLIKHGRLKIF